MSIFNFYNQLRLSRNSIYWLILLVLNALFSCDSIENTKLEIYKNRIHECANSNITNRLIKQELIEASDSFDFFKLIEYFEKNLIINGYLEDTSQVSYENLINTMKSKTIDIEFLTNDNKLYESLNNNISTTLVLYDNCPSSMLSEEIYNNEVSLLKKELEMITAVGYPDVNVLKDLIKFIDFSKKKDRLYFCNLIYLNIKVNEN